VAARYHEEEEEAKQPGRGGSVGFCSSARPVEERERERERGGGHGRAQDGGRRGGDRRCLGRPWRARARQDSKARLERRARSG
jgi:hypothetical protein